MIFSILISKLEKNTWFLGCSEFAGANGSRKSAVIYKTKSLDSKLQAGLREEEAGDEGPDRAPEAVTTMFNPG